MCSETCMSEKKNFQWKNIRFFSFKCLIFDFSQIFILQQCLNPNPYPKPNFFFGFGFSQNIRIISDSDPQHCLLVPVKIVHIFLDTVYRIYERYFLKDIFDNKIFSVPVVRIIYIFHLSKLQKMQ
jgi:hypothetical protein